MMKYLITALAVISTFIQASCAGDLPKLKISENKRFLEKEDGTPFIWIGDTFWDWYKLSPAELDEYLIKRASQGYTVIQIQIAAYGRANYAGNWCFGGVDHKDITQPQEAFWEHADLWMEKIAQHGMYAAVGLGWIINSWNPTGHFSETDFYNYGKWVGNRYKNNNNIVWISLNESTYQGAPINKIKAVCQGIRDGDTGGKLLTLHPLVGSCTSKDFGDVVDFHSWQTGRFNAPYILPYLRAVPPNFDEVEGEYSVWEAIASDFSKEPVRPVIDLEAWYEGHLDDVTPEHSTGEIATAWHVRRRAWFTILAGAFGHTYGAAGLAYQVQGDSWRIGMDLPGGDDMRHIHQLLGDETRPFLMLAPYQELIRGGQFNSYDSHKQAARATDGSFAYVYSADGSSFTVDLTKLGQEGDNVRVQWFDPREGVFHDNETELERTDLQLFTPPGTPFEGNDWVLVLTADTCSSSFTGKSHIDCFTFYPNPVSTCLYLYNPFLRERSFSIELYDLHGRRLLSMISGISPFVEIDMRTYSPSLYIIKIFEEKESKSITKIIIKNRA